MENSLLNRLKETINEDNVNCIPLDWAFHYNGGTKSTMVDRCKSAGFGFLPYILFLASVFDYAIIDWFVERWSNHVNWDIRYPFRWIWGHCGDRNESPLDTAFQWSLSEDIILADRLIRAGLVNFAAGPFCFGGFRGENGFHSSDVIAAWKRVYIAFFDHGLIPFLHYDNPWLNDQCREYETRRAYCQRATVKWGGLLRRRRGRGGWDRHLISQLMQFVWATRWREEWNR